MRWVVYWSVVVAVAVMVAHAAATPHEPVEATLASSNVLDRQVSSGEGRAILLALGILAIAYTYQRAWLNWRGNRA